MLTRCKSLPDGADPDSFVRTFGADAFQTLLRDERRGFVDFLAQGARAEGLFETPEGKREAVDRVVAALSKIQDPILLEEYVRRAARALDVVEPEIRREVDLRTRRQPAPEPALRAVEMGRMRDVEQTLITQI